MTRRATSVKHYLFRDSVLEGSSDSRNSREPANPLQSTSLPDIKVRGDSSPAAETGLVPAVVVDRREGRDYADAQDASRTTAETQATPMPQHSLDSKAAAPSVLIIEDSTELAEIIQATLEHLNMVTAHETHGNKALSRYEELRPDVVLLDIGLPDMTGWKFLEAVKEKGEGMPVIIVITAYGDPANRLVGKLQNVHSYLVKPFRMSTVTW